MAGITDVFANVNLGGGASQITFAMLVILVVAVVVSILAYVFWVLSFRKKIMMFEKRANNTILINTNKARKIVESGIPKLQLFNPNPFAKKEKIPYPESPSQMYTYNNKDLLMLFRENEQIVQPVLFHNSEPTLSAVPQDVIFWLFQERKQSEEIYKNPEPAWKQYVPQIIFITLIVLGFVIMIVMIKEFGTASEKMAEAFTNGIAQAKTIIGQNVN